MFYHSNISNRRPGLPPSGRLGVHPTQQVPSSVAAKIPKRIRIVPFAPKIERRLALAQMHAGHRSSLIEDAEKPVWLSSQESPS